MAWCVWLLPSHWPPPFRWDCLPSPLTSRVAYVSRLSPLSSRVAYVSSIGGTCLACSGFIDLTSPTARGVIGPPLRGFHLIPISLLAASLPGPMMIPSVEDRVGVTLL
eukprot:2829450-Heterocapsa_arctica.AAC.1